MSARFFSETPVADDHATLVDAEAHHLLHVLRAKVGEAIVVFDGTGREFDAVVARTTRSTVEVDIQAVREVDRELPRPVILGVALPKGDRQKWLVEKVVELGATRLVPLVTRRGVVQPEGGTLEKLRRSVIEASKQCGRNRLMQIDAPIEWAQFVASAPEEALRRVAHPPALWPHTATGASTTTGTAQADESADFDLASWTRVVAAAAPARPAWLAVGPEGGFTDDEVHAALAAGWRPLGLGARILRIETAAIALVAATGC
ncbi:MAG: 16S rRNA (uracil(1498)-N(3))-methyltransferase [Pirellulales bacterium]